MNICFRELRAHKKSLLIWSLCVALLIIAGMGKYSATIGTGASLTELLAQMPKSLQNLMGVGTFDLTVAMDYYGVLFLYIQLVLALYAAFLGVGILAKEERDKTAEFLLSKPVSRSRIITFKLLAALFLSIGINLITWAVSYAMLSYYSSAPFALPLAKLMAAMFFTQLFFVALGAFLAGSINNPKRSSAIASCVLLVMMVLSIIIDITGKYDWLKYFTVFKYFDAKPILKSGYSILYPILTSGLITTLLYGTYQTYTKRDLKI